MEETDEFLETSPVNETQGNFADRNGSMSPSRLAKAAKNNQENIENEMEKFIYTDVRMRNQPTQNSKQSESTNLYIDTMRSPLEQKRMN